MVLARTRECKPGQECELRCCTLPGGDAQCRERCLGLSCELDGHCDGDCCVNSTCTSCLLRRFVTGQIFSILDAARVKASQPVADLA